MKTLMRPTSALFILLAILTACGPAPESMDTPIPATEESGVQTEPLAETNNVAENSNASENSSGDSACTLAPGNLIQNGDFETPVIGSQWQVFRLAQEFEGWKVTSGNVEIVGTVAKAASGNQTVDLVGTVPGAIAQELTLKAGQSYTLSFCLAGNVGGGNKIKTLNVQWNGEVLAELSFDTTDKTAKAMGWEKHTIEIPAAKAGPGTLSFHSLTQNASYFGAMIDAVSVVPKS